ncbi:vitamin K epoxide reductase family protein [Spirulina sp. CS-785/01]|uniref:vitamin K epoxide reductase family protein n=1 Tax=Spirulina sp. CS-785/01 TaxID=3021716 RepID=UPI002330C352|nr:vitamin K epoxide reductase family protein [Spirulina sp. CS-785/01]MDB9311545.1 vitamin K epoxide reductase family protein [Spirulina sp. CS-785/01]
MKRRRSQPWIHKWSRFIIGAIATVGVILTAYLTISKLGGGEVTCTVEATASASGCNSVLDSPYATVFGLPLSLFGLLAYLYMIANALSPYLLNSEEKRDLRKQVEHYTGLLMLIGSTAMAVFSGYLMYVLAFQLQTVCYYCIGSALFSLSLLLLTVFGRDWKDIGQLLFTGIIVALVTFIGTLGVYANINTASVAGEQTVIPPPTTQPERGVGWEVTTTSSPSEIALAEYLTEQDAIMYGGWSCPYCHLQKLLFGQEAIKKINYIECSPPAEDAEPQKCEEAGIRAYPSWEIDGQLYSGARPLEELAELSGYEGPSNFKYTF